VKTLNRPLRVEQVALRDGTVAFAGDGAPSDCVALALLGYIPEKVDFIVSGINTSANVGHDVTYSGTVTAVMEGIIFGVPGIAFSLDGAGRRAEEQDYTVAARAARKITRTVLEHGLPPGVFLNVNIPYRPPSEIRGIQLTRQGMRVYADRLDRRQDPRGADYFWIGGGLPSGVPEEGTDFGALSEGYVSVTPLQLDLTATAAFSALQDMGWKWSHSRRRGLGPARTRPEPEVPAAIPAE
jgi:5'-nucleotidase